ncbi:MAG: hypothetical protein LUQ65_00410 [Candidatus Helarchaeota archaeon]|nr:hypothetical protein [Candidatus Helarchaeota archaeon]
MTEKSPWTTFDIRINLTIVLILIGFSIFMLALKAFWVFLGLYILCWGLYIVVGRYVTCRHCDFLGKACPSWCMGILGGKLYKRSTKRNFCVEGGFIHAVLLDISFLIIAVSIPIIAYIVQLLTIGLLTLDYILLAVYLILALLTLIMHSLTGCKKCPIADCPMSGNHKRQPANPKQ